MIFHKQNIPAPCSDWISISFNEYNKLRLIGAPTELIQAFRAFLKGEGCLRSESWKEKARNAYEFRLNGSPWAISVSWSGIFKTPDMSTRSIMLKALKLLERYGWNLYGSVDQNTRVRNSRNVYGTMHSWYCMKKRD